ncbi:hypothetical protein ACFHW2_29490 [Actinomadura sp. LOL_016]
MRQYVESRCIGDVGPAAVQPVAWLLCDDSTYITVQTLGVSGGAGVTR